tara:strand:+ start:44 stop:493 length:450 start_codon:yes stop_codon:yes gene_type:complete
MKNLTEVRKYILDNNGISFNPFLMDAKGNYLMPNKGYMVSNYGTELIMPSDEIDSLISTCISKYAYKLNEDNYFGIWVENQELVFDISENVQDLKKAIIQGMTNKQDAIYDIVNMKTIYLPMDQSGTDYQVQSYRELAANTYLSKGKFN